MEKQTLAIDTRLGAFAIADTRQCPMSTNHWSLRAVSSVLDFDRFHAWHCATRQ
jgi:hypothetical protein